MDHAEQNKDVGDKNRGEQFQKILNPEMNDPEAPEVCTGEMVRGMGEQSDGVEGGDGERGKEEAPGQVSGLLGRKAGAEAAVNHHGPGSEGDGEQDLPEASKIEI